MCLSGTRSLEQRRKGKEKCVVPPSSFLSSSLRFFLPVLPWTRHELALDRSTRIRRVRTVELLGQVRFEGLRASRYISFDDSVGAETDARPRHKYPRKISAAGQAASKDRHSSRDGFDKII